MTSFIDFLYAIYEINPSSITKQLTGGTAERSVHWVLRRLPRDFTVFHNVLLPNSQQDGYSQIDHLVVSRYGIFCIETKGWTGKVSGNSTDDYLSVLYGHHRYYPYNPFVQNQSHIRTLNHILETYLTAPIIPLVVFPQAIQVKLRHSTGMTNLKELVKTIQSYTDTVYPDDTVKRIISIIQQHNSANNPIVVKNHQKRVALLHG